MATGRRGAHDRRRMQSQGYSYYGLDQRMIARRQDARRERGSEDAQRDRRMNERRTVRKDGMGGTLTCARAVDRRAVRTADKAREHASELREVLHMLTGLQCPFNSPFAPRSAECQCNYHSWYRALLARCAP